MTNIMLLRNNPANKALGFVELAIWHWYDIRENLCYIQNTSGEMKFALKVEEELNKMTYPEYRQLVVEAMLVLAMLISHDPSIYIDSVVKMDEVLQEANTMFLQQQVSERVFCSFKIE